MKNVRNRVGEFRERLRLSQAQLADLIGVSQGTISKIESGKHTPNIEIAFKLEKVFKEFDVDIHELFIV